VRGGCLDPDVADDVPPEATGREGVAFLAGEVAHLQADAFERHAIRGRHRELHALMLVAR